MKEEWIGENYIKVISIAFGSQPFRKLENLTVNFAERLTLIAGHNGIGKSTILALTTNIFGLSKNSKFKSYFDHEFYCNLEQMMHIDVTEVDSAQKAKATPPRVTCKVNDISVVKECSLTRRNVYQRARVVPRTLGKKPVDAGFHPHAIGRLAEALKTNAKKLNIQIIATTHSPRLIESIHPDGDGNALSPDAVVYLHDTVHPRLAPDQSLHAILADMSLKPVQEQKVNKLKVPIYFEDEEAAQFFGELFFTMARTRITRRHNVKLDLLPLGVGGSNLLKLPKHDPHFLDTVLIVDADTSLPHKKADRANIVKLPGASDENGRGMSPERTIKKFLEELAESKTTQAQQLLYSLNITNPTTDLIKSHFLSDGMNGNGREALKAWWIKHWCDLKSWGVITAWAKANPDQVSKLFEDVELAVAHVSKRKKDRLAKLTVIM